MPAHAHAELPMEMEAERVFQRLHGLLMTSASSSLFSSELFKRKHLACHPETHLPYPLYCHMVCIQMSRLPLVARNDSATKAPAGGRTALQGCCCPHRRSGASDDRLCRMLCLQTKRLMCTPWSYIGRFDTKLCRFCLFMLHFSHTLTNFCPFYA